MNRFAQCNTCALYHKDCQRLTGHKEELADLNIGYKKHLEEIKYKHIAAENHHNSKLMILLYFTNRLERNVYHRHIQKARSNPAKYMTVIVDGMDQQKTSPPFLPRESKSVQFCIVYIHDEFTYMQVRINHEPAHLYTIHYMCRGCGGCVPTSQEHLYTHRWKVGNKCMPLLTPYSGPMMPT